MALGCRLLATCVVFGVVAAGADGRGGDRWVWGRSDSNNRKASSIPGYVEPRHHHHHQTTTTPPPITTFRPNLHGLGRGSSPARAFTRITAHPFFLGPLSPFSMVRVNPPRVASDGTTKSRIPIDTAFDGAVMDIGDKYTTLDRLQQERGALPPLPKPKKHQLGGLHPDEVFYADDDLLIIKGGGFNSDVFEEPSQTLDETDQDVREGSATHVSSVVAPLPSPHHEYNGNIPSIVPPPHQMTDQPFSLFVESASAKDYILVPHVLPQHSGVTVVAAPPANLITNNHLDTSKIITRRQFTIPYMYAPPVYPTGYLTHPIHRPVSLVQHTPTHHRVSAPLRLPQTPQQNTFHLPANTLQLPHSLAGDTDVNFLRPLPPVNPQAEAFLPNHRTVEKFIPGRSRQQTNPHV
ncbi:hypothetical protein Pmani_006248 [Petrolisthes manimaculis]|uniref:Uncharacterized protein n=1 Tax=Petrolisthes manimaculis TaxID=1843537 RepID=A0AAE1QAM1_9EUCA|nr:hypothetical protein Pmani_006248 [Petrolisthes manimaculis]